MKNLTPDEEAAWDAQIEADIRAGKLDKISQEECSGPTIPIDQFMAEAQKSAESERNEGCTLATLLDQRAPLNRQDELLYTVSLTGQEIRRIIAALEGASR